MTPEEFAEYSAAVNAVRLFASRAMQTIDPEFTRAALVGVGLEAYEVEFGKAGVAAMLEARAQRIREQIAQGERAAAEPLL